MTDFRRQSGKALLWILLLAVIAAGLVYYFYFLDRGEPEAEAPPPPAIIEPIPVPEPEPESEAEPEAEQPPPPAPAEEEPVEEAEPLPPLAESDDEALETARDLMGEDPVRTNLVTESVIPRLVASVDALTLDEMPQNVLPVSGPGGQFEVTEDGLSQEINPQTGLPEPRYVLDPVNFQRYTPQVEVFESIDTEALMDRYREYYPLLQQSFRELGYPERQFEDRLVEVIDHLLDTPEPTRPVRLVKPEAFYVFEDPDLERLSAGQKVLIRMGPSNAARVKAKLSEIRAALQTQRE